MEQTKNEAIELAWGVIANAHGGDWDKASPEWKEAAENWRDKYVADIIGEKEND